MKTWNPQIKDCGFRLKGGEAFREVGILKQSVSLQRSQRVAPGKIRINLYISLRDDFLDPVNFVLCLHGRVTKGRVSLNDDESFWEEEQIIRNGLPAFLRHGLSWFDEFGRNSEVLSKWLEKAVAEKTSVKGLIEPEGAAHPEIEAMIAPYLQDTVKSAPMDYKLFLSLLKFEQGQRESACRYAHEYLENLRSLKTTFSKEPERTLNQLRKMGCSQMGRGYRPDVKALGGWRTLC